LSRFNIRVNCIGPTPIYTDLIKTVPKNKIDELIERQAIKRLGNFNDILNVVDFFSNDKSDFITGQTIYLGGVS
jgi:Dehydrogenases with different specificities (related to short-chain alcohol dehydrogenases)